MLKTASYLYGHKRVFFNHIEGYRTLLGISVWIEKNTEILYIDKQGLGILPLIQKGFDMFHNDTDDINTVSLGYRKPLGLI